MKVKKAKSSPKILSFEFVAQNYTDIIGSIVGLILLGLLFAPTSKFAFKFVVLQHSVASISPKQHQTPPPAANNQQRDELSTPLYDMGVYDVLAILFYSLVSVLFHSAIQTYLLDKSARRLHLSKIKNAKFGESGQLLTFYAASLVWALELIRRERFAKGSWTETIASEQQLMTAGVKWFYIIQVAYWLHCIPMYFLEKVKKEDINLRASYVCLYIPAIICAYMLRITKVTLVLLALHYAAEAIFHFARMMYFKQSENHLLAFRVWNVIFVLIRFASITLTFLVFFLGIGSNSHETLRLNIVYRYLVLAFGYALQAQLMWKYITFHIKRLRPATKVVETKRSKRID